MWSRSIRQRMSDRTLRSNITAAESMETSFTCKEFLTWTLGTSVNALIKSSSSTTPAATSLETPATHFYLLQHTKSQSLASAVKTRRATSTQFIKGCVKISKTLYFHLNHARRQPTDSCSRCHRNCAQWCVPMATVILLNERGGILCVYMYGRYK